MPGPLQAAINQISGRVMAVVARHTGNRDTLLSEKILYFRLERFRHGFSP
jgi:hypothetical protein